MYNTISKRRKTGIDPLIQKCKVLFTSLKNKNDNIYRYDNLIKEFEKRIEDKKTSDFNNMIIVPQCTTSIKKGIGNGDKRLKKIFDTLNNFKVTRSILQKQFHDKFIQACLSQIFQEEYETQRRRLYKQFKISEISKEIFICAPRR
jgi:ribosome maturation protein Sdo1